MKTEATKPTNYTPAQEKIIRDAIEANDGVADKTLAETLAADERMNDDSGPRKARSIIAKMTRMEGVTYTKATPVSKTGKPIASKSALVEKLVSLSGVTAAKLNGLENAPKLALETLVEAFAAAA